ncbi:hypothetical protein FRB96_006371 [Tulasnella sp. 330]|nr:hypothetical protein FRB96_006371 [Tulasnella sp. 330]KAG8878818.1 hypothetical protein FRB97_002186 [Tulasnella sp. 331]
MSSAFIAAVAARRTYYGLSKASPIPDAKIKAIVADLVKNCPSSFNSQSSRAVIFFGADNDRLWLDVVKPTYFEILSDEAGKKTYGDKIAGYAAGYGTVIFFEDQAIVDGWAAKMPALAGVFPVWSGNSTGMLQFAVWTALETEGLGASLQHFGSYSPSTDPLIQKTFGLPSTWKSTAMMPFGTPVGGPGGPHPKTFDLLDERVRVIGSESA